MLQRSITVNVVTLRTILTTFFVQQILHIHLYCWHTDIFVCYWLEQGFLTRYACTPRGVQWVKKGAKMVLIPRGSGTAASELNILTGKCYLPINNWAVFDRIVKVFLDQLNVCSSIIIVVQSYYVRFTAVFDRQDIIVQILTTFGQHFESTNI